ncbi:MAG: hypothetical protein DRI46_09690 [Chloroflexi bacterium]|nr:MAG: hypothetical protein DRI46_09690 [Chloroflexota bacterium]
MSHGERLPYKNMMAFAEGVLLFLAPFCERIELAGSLRRKCSTVGDIEIIAVPKTQATLFPGDTIVNTNIQTMVDHALREKGCAILKDGPRYKQFIAYEQRVDLFLQPDPATWGMNMVIRTGAANFSRWMVTGEELGGALPSGWYVRNGRVFNELSETVETPEEKDVFNRIGLQYIPLEERNERKWYKYKSYNRK